MSRTLRKILPKKWGIISLRLLWICPQNQKSHIQTSQFHNNLTHSRTKLKKMYRNKKIFSTQQGKILNNWHSVQNYQSYKEAEKCDSWRKKNWTNQSGPSVEKYMLELMNKDIETIIITICQMFKKLEERINK